VATRAEEFHAQAERLGSKKQKRTAPPPSPPRLTHNQAHRLEKKSTHAIEQGGARASRKSTRGGANRAKPDSAQRITARIANALPKARAGRVSGNPT
jgi:hypothetical protein